MKKILLSIFFIVSLLKSEAQVSTTYEISFENAVHHEAQIDVTFENLKTEEVEFRMSRTSPGRYALHEFAKNVYNVKATDSKGNDLVISRPDPYSWTVKGHDGTVHVSYTLFANRGDGTYAQIDESHAHLNIPATFIYVEELASKEIEVTFNIREDLNWKVATQLKLQTGTTYYAKDLQYFMDSPTEISNHSVRSFEVEGQIINFVLHHNGTESELDQYFESVKKIVLQEKAVYGELPQFDYGDYKFIACYIPNASGDGMEHRNSTILTNTRSLADGGLNGNLGTVSHEFFHAWNVERIRPKSLEPFNFEKANMSGELWFAEGFTSYYTGLILCRAGLTSRVDYIHGLEGTFNYVWNTPGREFFNPIEMSYQAPFVDAARAVDEENKANTFISYYSYGSMLGLALDLSLRAENLNLDDFMKIVWETHGKTFLNYTIDDLQQALNKYAGEDFGNDFFDQYIHKSGMPNYKSLFDSVGVKLQIDKSQVAQVGVRISNQIIISYARINSSAYQAGLTKGDKILKVGGKKLNNSSNLNEVLSDYKPNDKITVVYERFGMEKETSLTLQEDSYYHISLIEEDGENLSQHQNSNRDIWLEAK